jgi:hypothetical protein
MCQNVRRRPGVPPTPHGARLSGLPNCPGDRAARLYSTLSTLHNLYAFAPRLLRDVRDQQEVSA